GIRPRLAKRRVAGMFVERLPIRDSVRASDLRQVLAGFHGMEESHAPSLAARRILGAIRVPRIPPALGEPRRALVIARNESMPRPPPGATLENAMRQPMLRFLHRGKFYTVADRGAADPTLEPM